MVITGSLLLGIGKVTQYVIIPFVVAEICVADKRQLKKLGLLGRYSYGMYLTGFPVQQALISKWGGQMNLYTNMLLAIIISLIISIVLNKVEQKIMGKV